MIYDPQRTQLLHKVETKITIDAGQSKDSVIMCKKNCDKPAQVFCENDNAYFCEDCFDALHNSEINSNFFGHHKKVTIDQIPKQYGICPEHGKANEFFCNCCSNAYCSKCVISEVQKPGTGKINHNMIEIERAYTTACHSAYHNDDALEEKKKAIEERLQTVTKKMKKLKDNAVQI